MKSSKILIGVIFVLIVIIGVLGYLYFKKGTAPQPLPTPSPLQSPSPSPQVSVGSDVQIILDENSVRNNSRIFEPLGYTIKNNSGRSIFYLRGCGVEWPQIFNAQGALDPREPYPVCAATPAVTELKASESIKDYWDQRDYKGDFISPGQYRIGLKYSFESDGMGSLGKKETALSEIITVAEVNWSRGEEERICNDFPTDSRVLSKATCLNKIKE